MKIDSLESTPGRFEPHDPETPPGLGLWEGEAVMREARSVEDGSVSPTASYRGRQCLIGEPANWGSPSDPEGPCGSYRPLLGAEGRNA